MAAASLPRPLLEIFVDESSQTRNRHLLIGALVIPQGDSVLAADALQRARAPDLPKSEMKWGKVSSAKLPAYYRFVDTFFEEDSFRNAQFHCLTVDTSKIRHAAFSAGDAQVGFNKEIYQLARKIAKNYPGNFHLYLDRRETTQKTEELRLILNRGLRKQGDTRDWPFRRCQFRDSHKEDHLQLVDVLLGAVGYALNGHCDAPEASPAKKRLCAHVRRRAGVRDVHRDTAVRGKFTIWHRQLR